MTETEHAKEHDVQSGVPMIVTNDDLTMALGNDRIELMNHDKLLRGALGQVRELKAEIERMGAQVAAAEQLKRSNQQYAETNETLAASAASARDEAKQLGLRVKALEQELAESEVGLTGLREQLEKALADNRGLKARLAKPKTKPKTAKKR